MKLKKKKLIYIFDCLKSEEKLGTKVKKKRKQSKEWNMIKKSDRKIGPQRISKTVHHPHPP